MSKKPNGEMKKKRGSMNGPMKLFLIGCAAEFYLLLVRKYYIKGVAASVIAWDDYLRYIAYAGLAVFAVGAVLVVAWRKAERSKRSAAWLTAGTGAFFAVSALVIRMYYSTAVTVFCVAMPVLMLLGILWLLYDRECAYALTVMVAGVAAVWACRKGLHSQTALTHALSLSLACAFIALAAILALLVFQAAKHDGKLGRLAFLPAHADTTVIYASCGVSAAAVLASMFSTVIAYYAMWVLVVVLFAMAVYYTVKQL